MEELPDKPPPQLGLQGPRQEVENVRMSGIWAGALNSNRAQTVLVPNMGSSAGPARGVVRVADSRGLVPTGHGFMSTPSAHNLPISNKVALSESSKPAKGHLRSLIPPVARQFQELQNSLVQGLPPMVASSPMAARGFASS